MNKHRIAVIGSNMMDLISHIERMPNMGETIPAVAFDMGYGGKGANQAVAAARLGADVVMVSKVGDDLFGPGVIENMRKNGLDTTHVTTAPGHQSGVAPIFVDRAGQNAILIIKDANDCLTPEDVDRAEEDLRGCSLLLMQLEIHIDTVYHCLRRAREWGIPVVLNTAPFVPLDLEKLQGVDYIIPNEHELAALLDEPLASLEAVEEGAQRLQKTTGGSVIVTLGSKGSLLVDGGQVRLVDPYPVVPVDTTGAGDAFIGSFAVFLAESQDVLASMDRANRYAASSTLRRGTQKSYLTREEWEGQ